MMFQFGVELVESSRCGGSGNEIPDAEIGRRKVRQEERRLGRYSRCRNQIVRERLARRRICDRFAAGEVPGSFGGCREYGVERSPTPDPSPLVVDEEEGFVVQYRAAEGCAELVLPQGADALCEEIPCVGNVVPQKLVGAAVELVRARFQGDTDVCRLHTVLRRE